MKKDLEYYMNLPYKIEIEPIPEDEGGGYVARLPEVGRFTLAGDGDTPAEAMRSLNKIKKVMFKEWLEQGISIPEPEREPFIEEYSGKFVLRLPKYLHLKLSQEAKKNGVSLNQFVISLLASGVEKNIQSQGLKQLVNEVRSIKRHLFDVKDKLDVKTTVNLEYLTDVQTEKDHEYSRAA